MMFKKFNLNLGWFSKLLTISWLLLVLNLCWQQQNSIECISLTTIVNPLSWYWSPTVGFRTAATQATNNDQANVAKYLQMIQSFFPKNNRTFMIGSGTTTTTPIPITTEMPTTVTTTPTTVTTTTTTIRWPSSDDDNDVTLKNIPFQDVPRTTSEANTMEITSMAPTTSFEIENIVDDSIDRRELYFNNNNNNDNNNDILETTTTTNKLVRAKLRNEDEEDVMTTTTTKPESVQISSSPSSSLDLINLNPKINISEFETNQIQDVPIEIIERSMIIPTTTTTTTIATDSGSGSSLVGSKYWNNEIIEREQQRSMLEQSTNMIGGDDDVPATTVEPFTSDTRDNVFDLSTIDTIDTIDSIDKHSTTTTTTSANKMITMIMMNGNNVWTESGTTKPKPETVPELINEQKNVEQRTLFNSKNDLVGGSDDNDDGGNNFIKKFHDAYYSNSNIFDELMKRYPVERAHRAMKHFEDDVNIRTPQELTSNDLDAINQLFFGHNYPHPQHSRVHFDVENH